MFPRIISLGGKSVVEASRPCWCDASISCHEMAAATRVTVYNENVFRRVYLFPLVLGSDETWLVETHTVMLLCSISSIVILPDMSIFWPFGQCSGCSHENKKALGRIADSNMLEFILEVYSVFEELQICHYTSSDFKTLKITVRRRPSKSPRSLMYGTSA